MTDHVLQDWMDAPTSGTGLTSEEEAIVTDYVQCEAIITESEG